MSRVKLPHERVNRTKPLLEWSTLDAPAVGLDDDGNPADGGGPERPSGLRSYPRQCWEAWWSMPVSATWEPDDRLEVVRLVGLAVEMYGDEARGAAVAEFRRGLDRLGLTMAGRLAQRYLPAQVAEVPRLVAVESSRWDHLKS